MQVTTFRVLLVDELREIYYAEALVQEAYRRLVRGADSDTLKKFFEAGETASAEHQTRLEKVFELLHENPRGGSGHAMKALLREVEDRMGESGERHVLDAGLLLGAQRIVGWKVVSYHAVAEWAGLLRETEIASLLHEVGNHQTSLKEEVDKLAEELSIQAKVLA